MSSLMILEAAQAKVAATEVNARWQAEMSKLFSTEGAPDQAWELVPEVFNLEDQLHDSSRQATTA